MSMTPQKWSISALAVELDMDRRTISSRLKNVDPVEIKGRTRLYLMTSAAKAMYMPCLDSDGNGLDLNAETARLKKAQADKTELEVEVLKGTLISGEIVRKVWGDFVGACRAKLISIPSTASTRIVGLDVPECETELRELVHQALEELKDYEPTDYQSRSGPAFNTGGGKKDSTATKSNSKRVGRRKKVSKQRSKR